jgi:hypothetical protein
MTICCDELWPLTATRNRIPFTRHRIQPYFSLNFFFLTPSLHHFVTFWLHGFEFWGVFEFTVNIWWVTGCIYEDNLYVPSFWKIQFESRTENHSEEIRRASHCHTKELWGLINEYLNCHVPGDTEWWLINEYLNCHVPGDTEWWLTNEYLNCHVAGDTEWWLINEYFNCHVPGDTEWCLINEYLYCHVPADTEWLITLVSRNWWCWHFPED